MSDLNANKQNGDALPDIAAALQLFDETTRALEARSRRLEEVLTVKQNELVKTNTLLQDKVQELDQLSAYLNLVMASVSSGVMAVDCNGLITACNPAAEIMFSGVKGDLIEAAYAELFPDSELMQVTRDGIMRGPYEHRIRSYDGSLRIISAKASPICDSKGQVIGAVEVCEDVTDMRRLQEQLERGERLKALGEMAAGVAHEIRNPLNGIEGFASLLARDIPEDDKRHRYAQSVIDGVRHLNKTVTGLLEFTRPKQAEKRDVPITEIVQNCIELIEMEYENSEAEIAPSISFDNQWGADRLLCCDGTHMRQIILNVLSNAVQAVTDKVPELKLQCTEEEWDGQNCFALHIDDNGPGIPVAERKTIFTPFFTTKDSGTGLGLAVTHTLVELQGGKISVDESPALGGARITVLIP